MSLKKAVFYDESQLYTELNTDLDEDRHLDWNDFLEKMRENSKSVIENITKKNLEVHTKREAFQLFSILTKEECDFLIKETESIGYQGLDLYDKSYRSNTRRIILYDELRDIIWERVRSFLTLFVEDKFLKSQWKAYDLNPLFRFCRYEPGQHFSPHYDSCYAISSKNRSFYTFMIYLNGNFDGGCTHFLRDGYDKKERREVIEKLHPEPGMALIFQHNIYHEGEALRSGLKYMMRSDIMYKLEPIQDEDKQNKMENKLEAMLLINEAEKLELEKKYDEAVQCYKKAYKLSPELENISRNESTKDHPVLDTQ